MQLFLVFLFSLCSITLSAPLSSTPRGEKQDYIECAQDGDCMSNSLHCKEICGCDGLFIFNYTINECALNFDYVKQLMVEKHNTEEKIQQEAEKVFNGIIVAVLFFITCAGVCVVSACIYCCHITYTFKATVGYNRWQSCRREIFLMEIIVLATIGVLLAMVMLSCLCCLCMKLSDLRMKIYILRMARRKGLEVDEAQLDLKYKCQSPHVNDNCAIMVPDVGIIL